MVKKISILYILCSLMIAGSPQVSKYNSNSGEGEVAQYIVSDPPTLTMKVNIWGEVKHPGQYLVPYTMKVDIISLLSMAGGPTPEANFKKIIIIRADNDAGEAGKITVNMDEYFTKGELSDIPDLGPNDTVIIQKTFIGRLNSNNTIFNVLQLLATIYLITNG